MGLEESKTNRIALDSFEDFEDEFAFWPLNLILVVLGASIIGVAFVYLDARDNRLTHNPWTYVVVTPICLMLISVALRTLVSKVIQKSMQMAFLLSVLFHLFLLVGAMNVVIFSRLWPDMLEKMAKERHALKRQSLQAPQYHRVTSTKQEGARPDYLTHMPTQHEATEVEITEKLTANLAESAVNNLVSPVPEIERMANPHLIEQSRASPALPSQHESAAELSRSELRNAMQMQVAEQFELPRMQPVPKLSASSAKASRSRQDQPSSMMPLPSTELQRNSSASGVENLVRNERNDAPASSQQAASLERSVRSSERRSQSSAEIAVPEVQRQTSVAQLQPNGEAGDLQSRSAVRDSISNRLSSPATVNNSNPARRQSVTSTNVRRREQTPQFPQASIGQFSSAFERDTAGGRAGPPAASSMPVQGVNSVAGDQVGPPDLKASQLTNSRSGTSGRSASSSASLGMAQAPTWDGTPNLSSGVQGRSPSQLAAASSDGQAAGTDVAGLTGSGRVMQRSRTGLSGIAGPLSSPAAPTNSQVEEAGSAQSGSSGPLQASQLADSNGARRRTQSSGAAPNGANLDGSFSKPSSNTGAGLNQMVRSERASEATGNQADYLRRNPGRPFRRTETGSPGPAAIQSIEVPQLTDTADGMPSQSDGQSMKVVGRGDSRKRSSSSTNLLAIQEPEGVGGIARARSPRGELLPQRNEIAREVTTSDLETQRFARRDIGGPLAAGRISIPKPAFQQRIERLRDRESAQETSAEPQTELAIERGLEFLAKHQREDGSWRLQDFDTEVLMTSDTAATGLALLAFQGAGYTHKEFKYADVCGKALAFLVDKQQKNGDLYIPQNPASDQNAWLYSHGIAAIAICEAYGMTQDQELRAPAQLAVDFIADSQDKRRGGWRYRPGSGSDTSVSGWFMMAMMSAKLAGLQTDAAVLARLRGYLDLSQDPSGNSHLYRYNPFAANNASQGHGLRPTAVMTSVGLLMRLYTGWQRSEPDMQQGAKFLLQNLPEGGTVRASKRDTYYWYYATQVMFHMGGDTWEQWQDKLYPMLIANQVVDGPYEGSWNPVTPTPDLWARYGGRLYVTTMNLLSLEVSYRHLPLYEATGFAQQ